MNTEPNEPLPLAVHPPAAAASPALPPSPPGEPLMLSPLQSEAIVRIVEAAPQVRRRYQYFVWTQSHLQALIPHPVSSCAAWQRQQRELVWEALHNVVLSPESLALLTDGQGPLLRAVAAAWIEGRGRPLALELARFPGDARDGGLRLRDECGLDCLLVHGVSRPQRPAEVESLFVFGTTSRMGTARHLLHLEMLLPHLHATWLRVQATERGLGAPAPAAMPPARTGAPPRQPITERERQILAWVREGKSNHQIGEQLGISPLTVKNHIQKILRKLGAANRAQAVAQAMSLNLLGRGIE